jgi:GNAT superfamily N-acetyltransferase
MVSWREESVDSESAHCLLVEYFEARAEGFPGGPGAYRTVFPSPEQFEPPRGVFLVVVGDDQSGRPADVGCGGIREIAMGALGRRFEVKHLYLRPFTRGRGLGRALLAELEARALAFGATELVLDTNANLEAAGGLYRSSGFAAIPAYNDNPNATNWYLKRLR